MRTSKTLAIFVFIAALVAGGAAGSARQHSAVAPADEYFGRLKMSILGIRNELRDLNTRLSYAPQSGDDIMGTAAYVEDALRDWEHKYPADPWLAKNVYELTALYARVHTTLGYESAQRTLNWLLRRYGGTPYAMQARTELEPVLGSQ